MPNLKFQQINGGVVTTPALTDIFPYVSDPAGVPVDRQSSMQTLKDALNVDLVEATINTASGATAATISNSTGVIWDIPIAGIDAAVHRWQWRIDGSDFVVIEATGDGAGAFTDPKVTIDPRAIFNSRVLEAQGADVVSANDLTLGDDGNTFELTGGVQLNAIAIANWQNGSLVTLIFGNETLVKHNTAGGAGFASILLTGSLDFSATVGSTLTIRLSEQGGTQAWREVGRKV